MKPSVCLLVSITMVMIGFWGCQRDKTGDQSKVSQPAGTVEQAVQQGIKGPMDKARGVEGTLSQAAERTAEQASQATP